MNGAESLLATLDHNRVEVCFTNPGTTEIHLVAAFDTSPIRPIPCLFEGVATGAADGYARLSGRPAATLLHLGPGLANGWANLHNARRARVPVLNVVGDHATHHEVHDAPLQSNIASLAGALEGWSRRCRSAADLASDAVAALSAAYGPPGRVATLTLPADVSWGDLENVPLTWPVATRSSATPLAEGAVARAAAALRSGRSALLIGGALTREHLALAQRVTTGTSSRLMVETFPTIMDRGANTPAPERVPYLRQGALDFFCDLDALVLVGAREPITFFAHRGQPSTLTPEGCDIIDVAPPGTDSLDALEALANAVTPLNNPPSTPRRTWDGTPPRGELTRRSFARVVAATLPEGAVVIDESLTSGVYLYEEMTHAPEHQWVSLTGGSIGFALPAAVGAAVASRRRVLALESDGSMMYTNQALWTMARESLDVTVVALANGRYAILEGELAQLGPRNDDAVSARLLRLEEPALDLSGQARALGVPSTRVTTADELAHALVLSYATSGPTFIEAVTQR